MGPREFSFHYRGTGSANEPSGPNGSGCIWSQPIKQISEQLQLRASGPAAAHIWTANRHQWQPEAPEARAKMEVAREEKAPRGDIL